MANQARKADRTDPEFKHAIHELTRRNLSRNDACSLSKHQSVHLRHLRSVLSIQDESKFLKHFVAMLFALAKIDPHSLSLDALFRETDLENIASNLHRQYHYQQIIDVCTFELTVDWFKQRSRISQLQVTNQIVKKLLHYSIIWFFLSVVIGIGLVSMLVKNKCIT
jgi:hypothetical protein